MKALLLASILAMPTAAAEDAIEHTWLAPAPSQANRVVVCWETAEASDSTVEFGEAASLGRILRASQRVTLHRVEIAPPAAGAWRYRVRSGKLSSKVIAARGWERGILKVVVVGDLGYARSDWAAAVLRERPHLLLSAGDNVAQLHRNGVPAPPGDVSAFRELIASAPALFGSTPFLPVLGNHDRELRPRGPKPPAEPVYDLAATAFRQFFALPGDGIKWTFDLPAFGVRFVAVDLSHTSDLGTTWQTCNDYREGSEQLDWYRRAIAASRQPFLITLYNERHAAVRRLAQGAWWPPIRKGSVAITGFGYFAERAVVEGLPCFNTSVSGKGDRYPDPSSTFLASEDNYVLLSFVPGRPMRVELKSLAGALLDAIEIAPRQK